MSAASFYGARVNNFPINSFSSWCFQRFSVYFSSRLHVSFSPCDQTLHIGHPGFQQPLHPVTRFYCFPETFENRPPLSTFSGTATGGAVPWLQWASKIPTLQDLEASRQDSCDHYASWNNVWLRQRNFIKKDITNHCVYQFQSLSMAIPETREFGTFQKKKAWNSDQPITSYSTPPWHQHTAGATLQWIQWPSPHPVRWGAPWRNKAGVLGRGVVQLKVNLYSSVFVGAWNRWLSNIFYDDGDGAGIQTFKKKYESSWSTYPILSPTPFSLKSQSLEATKTICLFKPYQSRQLRGATWYFLEDWSHAEILEPFHSNEIVAFYTSQENRSTLRKLPPFHCSRLTESPHLWDRKWLQQIGAVSSPEKVAAAEIDGPIG